jgi:hypothetical protein
MPTTTTSTAPTTATAPSTATAVPDHQPPAWTRGAHRLDRPKIDAWYKPEDRAALDGVFLWQGDAEHRMSGETYHVFVVREHATGLHVAVAERAALRFLRQVRAGSRVYVRATGKKDIGDGKAMWEFEAYAENVDHGRLARKPAGGRDDDGGEGVPF